MAGALVGPGEDVEAWCTRCKMNLNHRVVAVVGNNIQRVICLTCGSDHKYYPPRNQIPSGEERRRTGGAQPEKSAKSGGGRAANKAYGEWTTFMKDMPVGSTPKPYMVSGSYQPSDYVEHPLFGTGRVLEIVGAEKIQVIFKEGRKVLICNRKN